MINSIHECKKKGAKSVAQKFNMPYYYTTSIQNLKDHINTTFKLKVRPSRLKLLIFIAMIISLLESQKVVTQSQKKL